MPSDPMAHTMEILRAAEKAPVELGTKRILVVGDSWGTLTAVGSGIGVSFFERKLKEHSCPASSVSIAIPGTTTADWLGDWNGPMKVAAKLADYVWIVLMGNDALLEMPDCATLEKKSAAECGDKLFAEMTAALGKIVDDVHEANPNAKIVGFGYDTMFGGLGCRFVTSDMFPQCYKIGGGGNRCFNTEFLRIQETWDTVASNRSWVTNTSILGATQVAGGDAKASTDPASRHIDMDKMGPAKYWPDYLGCFHPGVFGGDNSGAMVVMEEFYKSFWAKELGC